MKRLCNLRYSKKGISLALMFTGLAVVCTGSIVAHASSQDADIPPVGQEWIKVKIPLKMGYHSTAESKHKEISSNSYEVENLSDHPVSVSLSGFVGQDGSSSPVTTGIDSLNMNLDNSSISLISGGIPKEFDDSDKSVSLYTLGAKTKLASGKFTGPSSGTLSFSGRTQSNINVAKETVLNNQLDFTLTPLDGDGNIPSDLSSITVRNSSLTPGTQYSPSQNYVSGTDEFGNNLSLNKVTIGGDKVNVNVPALYNVTYSYRNIVKTASVTIKDLTTFNVHDSTINIGTVWSPKDNFDGGKNEVGQPLDINKVTIGGDNLDTSKVGTYKVNYTYRKVSKTATIIVTDKAPKPGTDNTIDFMNQTWDIIKGPDKMGSGNYLISMQKAIGEKSYIPSNGTDFFYATTLTGNPYDFSLIKPMVDKWYADNIQGTDYEKYVQPAYDKNISLPEAEALGWHRYGNTDQNDVAFEKMSNPDAFPTTLDASKGKKKAFLLSGSDLSRGGTNLSANAIQHKQNLLKNNITASYLRNVGLEHDQASAIDSRFNHIGHVLPYDEYSIVPALIVHIS